jgi:Tol biopolymer transport system component
MKNTLLLPLLALFLSGCVSELQVNVTPGGAKVAAMGDPEVKVNTAGGKTVVSVPTEGLHKITVSLPGYDTVTYPVSAADIKKKSVSIALQPLFLDRTFTVTTVPEGAKVFLDGREMGVTPFQCPVRFNRVSASAPWDSHTLALRLGEWQEESVVLGDSSAASVSVALSRLHLARHFAIKTVTSDGQALDAQVAINGKIIGAAPVAADLVFERADKTQAWPVFSCSVGIVDEYKEKGFAISVDSPGTFTITLDPVTEMSVVPAFPAVVVGPRGAQYVVDAAARTAAVDTREASGTVAELRLVTNYRRKDHLSPQVNSFAISPNGQSIVYALSETAEDGTVTSNLWQTSTDQAGGARQRLTSGAYLDSIPQLPVGDSDANQLLVFQSNRGVRESADISSINLADGRVVGGITQVTRESRYNYNPTIIRQNWELFFLSTEDHYPQAVPQVSYMRVDGSSASYMNETASSLTLSPDGRQVYFVHKDGATGKKQIFSMPREGYPVTQVISLSAFAAANCDYPAVSPDGTMLLFSCDLAQDASGRASNDIYLMNISSGQISPLITNASDDIRPTWSPVDPGVVYFLSNRGGSYNVWRFRLVEAQ